MRKNRVGETDVYVTELSFGCSSIANLGRVVGNENVHDVLDHAWNAGIRYFDTAPHYGRGLSEQRLGKYLAQKDRDDYVISTKVGRVLSPGQELDKADGFIKPLPNAVRYDYTADGILESFEHSCKLLGSSHIDIVFVHDIGDYTHGVEKGARYLDELLGSGFKALRDLKQAGKIGAIGLGVNETKICMDVMQREHLDTILLAGRLTLLDREAEEGLLELCAQHHTSLVLGGIFNSGILATGPKPGAWFNYAPAPEYIMAQAKRLEDEAGAVGLSLAEAAIQFGLRHPSACSVLLGTRKVSSLVRNLKAAELELSGDALEFVTS
ncbi:MAG: aldo/keto reductase [Rhizobiaceae bacterium]|nr:aldo/keto reductase [Rhizobiaceae bacterium]